MQLQAVRRRVRTAISNLIVEDYRLLTLHAGRPVEGAVSERALSTALAWQLKRVFDTSWDVDCEYNRVRAGVTADCKRVRRDQHEDPLIVLPDIIIHRRGESDPMNNLLFIEVKKTNDAPLAQAGRGGVDTAGGATEDLAYQHGLFLTLGLDRAGDIRPRWAWIHGLAAAGAVTTRPVYSSPANLTALIDRGAELAARRYGALVAPQQLLA